ncbi:MAG TPA: DUF4160 domain-containing protein [Xanthobacteraceae bacterium]|jgi:hypothetical protein|nr:DUF4160 domain-containing protein [Xanthobacteraceae bacterium]
MPTIATFYGIVIYMYWRDHAPPHIHAMYQGHEALIGLNAGEVIGGNLPPNALRIVREWVILRRSELAENWQHGRDGTPFRRVPGPDEST